MTTKHGSLLHERDDEGLLEEYEFEELHEEEVADGTTGGAQWKRSPRSAWLSTLKELLRRRPRAFLIIGVSIAVLVLFHLAWSMRANEETSLPPWPRGSHPIDTLMSQANAADWGTSAIDRNPRTIEDAAAAYRERRGRHPPPMFDMWFKWAKEHDCIAVEDMFDQVHEDIEPFWGADAATMRANAQSFVISLSIRGGKTEIRKSIETHVGTWEGIWQDMLHDIPTDGLPDVDMPINIDDVAHIYTPWEEISQYVEAAKLTKKLRPTPEMVQQYTPLPPPHEQTFETFTDYPSELKIWDLVRQTCHPNSAARNLKQEDDMTTPSRFSENVQHKHMLSGFVSNWTASKSACEVPELRNLHGTFVHMGRGSMMSPHFAPDDRMATRQFFPLFSAGKIAGVNNDILLPPATSYIDWFFRDDKRSWSEKKDQLFWRGSASGGNNTGTTWTHFHRHRFLSAVNGTQYAMQEQATGRGPPAHVPGGQPPLPWNIPLPSRESYNLAAASATGTTSSMGTWISSWADAAFNSLACFWAAYTDNKFEWFRHDCPYTSPFYANVTSVEFENNFNYKYLPDIDGHGYSGRFRAFMESDSLPIKATIWSEWSANRFVPWKHFVPMDNTFRDIYGIMDYFLGYEGSDQKSSRIGHDAEAKRIADAGRDWSRKVLKKEDMVLYMWRVVLEYARALDDRREEIGFVQDLLDASR